MWFFSRKTKKPAPFRTLWLPETITLPEARAIVIQQGMAVEKSGTETMRLPKYDMAAAMVLADLACTEELNKTGRLP